MFRRKSLTGRLDPNIALLEEPSHIDEMVLHVRVFTFQGSGFSMDYKIIKNSP